MAPTGGAGDGATGGSGGTITGGASGSGGTASGGTSGSGGTAGLGGDNPSGGTSTGGNGAGGAATTGGSSDGGATTGGTAAGGASTGGSGDMAGAGGVTGTTFTLTSPGWTNMEGCGPDTVTSCAPLPTEITRSGAGTSPELHWTGAPEGTQSFVVLFQDLSNGTAHWILWNIPSTVTMLTANVDQTTATPATPAGSQQCGKGIDAAASDGYYGPGAPCNVYEFVVYALGISQFSPTDATDQEAVRTQLQALGSSILATASLRGRTDQSC
jgi:Raf kinase inhibitor-like YbhB/YbcL family protein